MPAIQKFKVCSLFSGCGGFDLGFVGGFKHLGYDIPKLPFEIVFANDFDKDAVNIYRENSFLFGHDSESCILHEDIRNVSPGDVSPFDVLLAGFPCQPFSSAGNRKGVFDHRGTLFEEVFKFIKNGEPDIVILENVRGILSSKMPDGTPVTEQIRNLLKQAKNTKGKLIGYNVSEAMLLNSSHFGVPQNRSRVIIIASKKGDPRLLSEQFIKSHRLVVDEDSKTVSRVIHKVKNLPNSNEVWDLSPQQKKMVPHIKRSWKDIPYEILPQRFKKIRDNMKLYHSPNFYRRFGLNEICGTITASAQPENCGILHPLNDRRYTVREIARFQSFPDNFTFNSASIANKYKVIGNAVAPVFSFALANLSLSLLKNKTLDCVVNDFGYAMEDNQTLLAI